MEKVWLESYPFGVPAEVDVSEFSSLKNMLEWCCARFSAAPALSNQGSVLTYADLDALSKSFASYLQNVLYLGKGDRVAIMLPNLLQYPVVLFGALRAGCTVVNINPQYTARELQHQLIDSKPVCIVILENFAHTLEQAIADTTLRCVITSRVGDLFHFPKGQLVNFIVEHVKKIVPEWHISNAVGLNDVLGAGAEFVLRDVDLNQADVAFLQYTGGTTGVPKAAILSHGNIVSNLLQVMAWVKPVLKEGEEIAVIPLPMYHIFSLMASLLFFRLGAKSILITNPRDVAGMIKEIRHSKFSAIIGVNTLFNMLLNAPQVGDIDVSHVKVAIAGGMAVQAAVAQRWHAVFGVPLIEGYGMTETSPIVCANPLTIAEFTGSIGLPVPSTEVSIRDGDGVALPLGELGEICVRGPQVMQGYWCNEQETSKVFFEHDWLRTGDLGVMDQHGYVKLVDRQKDMIVVSGFKVFPNEVEQVVMMLEGVLEVAAIPEADERSGHVVRVVVVTNNPQVTDTLVIEHCRRNLTGYKVPKSVLLRDQPLPKSAIGKILRRMVSEEVNAMSCQA